MLFPGIALAGSGYLDDLVVTDRYVLPTTNLLTTITSAGMIGWPSDFGRQYQVEACTDLVAAVWQPLGETATGNGLTNVLNDATYGLPRLFYQVIGIEP